MYVAQAYKALRLPRWDWTDPRIATLGLPTILLEERMLVTNPQRPLGPKLDLHNPLHSYLMQADAWKTAPPATTVYGNKLRNSQPFNISTGQYTYRYPKVGANGQLESDSPVFNAVFKKVVRALDIEIRLAMQPNTWDCWALVRTGFGHKGTHHPRLTTTGRHVTTPPPLPTHNHRGPRTATPT